MSHTIRRNIASAIASATRFITERLENRLFLSTVQPMLSEGPPVPIPARIEAENTSGFGHITSGGGATVYSSPFGNPTNNVVMFAQPGDWLHYNLHATESAIYRVRANVSDAWSGAQFHITIDSKDVGGPMTVQSSQYVYSDNDTNAFWLDTGDHWMNLYFDKAGPSGSPVPGAPDHICGLFDSFDIDEGGTGSFNRTPFNVATDTIEAENFDFGPLTDTTPQNINGRYRPFQSVDINAGGSNGYSVGYAAPGERLNYTINSPTNSIYQLQARVASHLQGGTFHVEIDGKNVTGALTIPDSGPWDTWTTITSPTFAVTNTTHTMTVVMEKGGYWQDVIGDFDYFKFIKTNQAAPPVVLQAVPYHGAPADILSTAPIQAEDFDFARDPTNPGAFFSGEGITYHDTTPTNLGGQYRFNDAVDLIPAVSPQYNGGNVYALGYTAPGEWLQYTISATAPGSYLLQSRVANQGPGGTFHVEIDGTNVTGALSIPDTGSYFNYATLSSKPFNFSAGTHIMRVVMDSAGPLGNIGNFDSFQFAGSTPFSDHPLVVGVETVEAENFNNGGEGIAFHDTTPQNLAGKYRTTAVDINSGGSNGFNVGYTAPGEWLAYSINSPTGGSFVLQSSVASLKPGGKFHVEIDSQNVTGALSVPDTTGWFTFKTVVSPKFTVSPGNHLMRVVMDSPGDLGAIGNFDYFRFAPAGIVTLVSQDRSVMTGSFERTPPEETRQAGPGNFGSFDQILTFQSTLDPNSQFTASQSSMLSVSATGAKFTAQGSAFGSGHSGAGGDSQFRVDFDVPTAVAYKVTFNEQHNPAFPIPSAILDGPSGFPITGFENMDNVYTGTLDPGAYFLTTSAAGGQQYDLKMYLGSAIAAP
jgi:hypothetical protein